MKQTQTRALPPFTRAARRQAAPPGWLLSLPLPLPPSDILTAGTGYQRQDTAIPSPLSALTSYSSSRWPDGILGKYTAAFSAWNIVKKELNLKGKSSHSFSPFCYPSLIIICSIFPRDLGKKLMNICGYCSTSLSLYYIMIYISSKLPPCYHNIKHHCVSVAWLHSWI